MILLFILFSTVSFSSLHSSETKQKAACTALIPYVAHDSVKFLEKEYIKALSNQIAQFVKHIPQSQPMVIEAGSHSGQTVVVPSFNNKIWLRKNWRLYRKRCKKSVPYRYAGSRKSSTQVVEQDMPIVLLLPNNQTFTLHPENGASLFTALSSIKPTQTRDGSSKPGEFSLVAWAESHPKFQENPQEMLMMLVESHTNADKERLCKILSTCNVAQLNELIDLNSFLGGPSEELPALLMPIMETKVAHYETTKPLPLNWDTHEEIV